MKSLVLYHGNCYDGFGAAYSAWLRFKDLAEYRAVSYGKPLPNDADNFEHVYILDFSYPRDQILALCEKTKVTLLDHHKTAEADLKDLSHQNLTLIFDMTRSGALIAWEYFHSDESGAVPYNALIEHISDRDLWKFELKGSKEVHSALVSLPFDFEIWDNLDVTQLIKDGAACLRFESSVVDKITDTAWISKIDDFSIPIVNTAAHWSEVGEALLHKNPEATFVASFTEFKDCTMWSLRSKGDFDVSAVAKKFGGGGHKNAAGFKVYKS